MTTEVSRQIQSLAGQVSKLFRENAALSARVKELTEENEGLRSTLVEVKTGLRNRMAEVDALISSLATLRRNSERTIEVTRGLCSCGGSAPDDPKACDACKIYHALTRPSAEKGGEG